MNKTTGVAFAKFHGLGNDFILAQSPGLPRDLGKFSCAITDRHTGIGADGFLRISKPADRKNDAQVQFFNADGSEAEMSGNGIRCVGAFLLNGKRAKRWVRIETRAGLKVLELTSSKQGARRGKWSFRVDMGMPILDSRKIPFATGKHMTMVIRYPLHTHQGVLAATVTSMGNPHCSIFVDDFSDVAWQSMGEEIERHPFFPNRTNVEFVRVISRNEIEVRYWERGVGQTMSSGTGSCGAVVASVLNGFTRRRVKIRTLAGTLEVFWSEEGKVFLSGPAEMIARGIYYARQ